MSRHLVVHDGSDPLTVTALRYVVDMGVPARDVRRVQVDSKVGEVQTIIVTIMVDADRLAAL